MIRTEELESLINLPYAVEVVPDATTDGEPCYLASHPELPGCLAHGDTANDAIDNLNDARRLYIETLLERGLQVPRPQSTTSGSHGSRWEIIWTHHAPSNRDASQSFLEFAPA